MSSPLQMAKAECANLVGDVCLGIPWQCLDGGRKLVGRERHGCLLSNPKGQDPPLVLVNALTCDCGEQMPKGRRMCDSCARKNRRETYRRARAKR